MQSFKDFLDPDQNLTEYEIGLDTPLVRKKSNQLSNELTNERDSKTYLLGEGNEGCWSTKTEGPFNIVLPEPSP